MFWQTAAHVGSLYEYVYLIKHFWLNFLINPISMFGIGWLFWGYSFFMNLLIEILQFDSNLWTCSMFSSLDGPNDVIVSATVNGMGGKQLTLKTGQFFSGKFWNKSVYQFAWICTCCHVFIIYNHVPRYRMNYNNSIVHISLVLFVYNIFYSVQSLKNKSSSQRHVLYITAVCHEEESHGTVWTSFFSTWTVLKEISLLETHCWCLTARNSLVLSVLFWSTGKHRIVTHCTRSMFVKCTYHKMPPRTWEHAPLEGWSLHLTLYIAVPLTPGGKS